MSDKTFIPDDQEAPVSQIGATLEALAATIAARRESDDTSYTHRLLSGSIDNLVKKVMEEADEVALAAKDIERRTADVPRAIDDACDAQDTSTDALIDHLRYEAADVIYHLMVVLERYDVTIDEIAAELNNRMRDDECPSGGVRLYDDYVQRGK